MQNVNVLCKYMYLCKQVHFIVSCQVGHIPAGKQNLLYGIIKPTPNQIDFFMSCINYSILKRLHPQYVTNCNSYFYTLKGK